MVYVPANVGDVAGDALSKLLYSKELIDVLAQQLVAEQVESHIAMIADSGSEYATFDEVEVGLKAARDACVEYMEDLLTDFRERLYESMANVNVIVTAVKLERAGMVDADVTITMTRAV